MKRFFVAGALFLCCGSVSLPEPIHAKPRAAKGGAGQSYAQRFSALDKQLAPLLLSLTSDIAFAYNPYTPPERMVNLAGNTMGEMDFETGQAWLKVRAQQRYDFLKSAEGKAWMKKRTAMRQALQQNYPRRAAAIRRLTARMRALSPVPKGLRIADEHVINYSLTADALVGLYKQAMLRSNIEDLGLSAQSQALSAHYNAATEEIGRYNAVPHGKVYTDD